MPPSAPSWLLGCRGASLERGRADLAERGVAPPLVVEHLDVVEQFHLRLAEAVEPVGELAFQRREEALHHRVVIAITTTAHAAPDPVLVEHRLVVLAGVGATLV